MSEDWNWNPGPENAETDSQRSAPEEELNENVTYHFKYPRRNRTETEVPYAHYQVETEETKTDSEEKNSKENKNHKDEKDHKEKETHKGLGSSLTRGMLFGLAAGIVFQGVNLVSERMFPKKTENSVGNAEILNSVTSTDSNESETVSAVQTANEKGPVAGVAQAAMPSVVAITSVSMQEIRSFFGYGMEYPSTGSGSGIIVGENEEELLIATNNHVVEGATTLSVCFIGSDVVNAEQEAEYFINGNGDLDVEGAVSAKIKGTDEETDLAVIAVEKSAIPEDTMNEIKIAQLGNSDGLVVGEQVVAIGNALGYGQTVTSGWVSALERTVQSDSNIYEDLIQTDAAINPGNSGGALLNMQGELIGINCAKIASSTVEGTGYAIPISKAQPILEELMNRKTRDKVSDAAQAAYLGVRFADLSREAIQMYNMPSGAFVMEVITGEAADLAGIQKSDIITKLDGQKVSGKSDINEMLQYYVAGEEIQAVVARLKDGQYTERTVTIILGTRPNMNQ